MTADAAILDLLSRRAQAEVDLLAAVATNHASGVNLCRSLGVSHHDFAADDTRLLWLSLGEYRLRPKYAALWACVAALRQARLWQAAAGPNPGPLWHLSGLLGLFVGRYDRDAVRRQALLVIELARRGRAAEWHAREVVAAVQGDEEAGQGRMAG